MSQRRPARKIFLTRRTRIRYSCRMHAVAAIARTAVLPQGRDGTAIALAATIITTTTTTTRPRVRTRVLL